MSLPSQKIVIATRGSALALAQSNMVRDQCRHAFPDIEVELRIIKTTGDKLQTASLASQNLPKGLFTKELEVALLNADADMAVHSLKDLPTELPPGLVVGAVSKRADVRDVLVYRDEKLNPGKRGFKPHLKVSELPQGATIASSSMRRQAQLLNIRPDLKVVPIRGNVPTRLKKISEQSELDGTILAAAGMERLHFVIESSGPIHGEGIPQGLLATKLETEQMLPCVGQAAIGIEIRSGDERLAQICEKLNDPVTRQCVSAERAFLEAMGGGCQLAVAAYAQIERELIRMRGISFLGKTPQRGEVSGPRDQAVELGRNLAAQLTGRDSHLPQQG